VNQSVWPINHPNLDSSLRLHDFMKSVKRSIRPDCPALPSCPFSLNRGMLRSSMGGIPARSCPARSAWLDAYFADVLARTV
jgi:hypothetical protein